MPNQGRKRFQMETLGEGRLLIGGRFQPNGSSAVDMTTAEGTTGWTVAWTSTGLFTVTLDDVWQYAFNKQLTLELTAGDDKMPQWGVIALASKTLQIRIWDISAAAVADIANDAGNWIDWGMTLKRSANTGKR